MTAKLPNSEGFMFSTFLRSSVSTVWRLGLLIALVVAASLWYAAPAAADGLTFRVALPMVMNAQPAIVSTDSPILEVVQLTNALRQQNGCPALTISPELSAAASM